MPKLSIETHGDAIRLHLNMLEHENASLKNQNEALKTVNESLKRGLKSCINADSQMELIEDNKTLTEMLELVIKAALQNFVPDIKGGWR